jgi:predicted MFS family arabinose efflux permease
MNIDRNLESPIRRAGFWLRAGLFTFAIWGVVAALLPIFIGSLSHGGDKLFLVSVGLLSVVGASLGGIAARRRQEISPLRLLLLILVALALMVPATLMNFLLAAMGAHPP